MKSSVNASSSFRSLLSRSMSVKQRSQFRNPKISKSQAENTPPADPNIANSDIEFAPPKPQEISRVDGASINSLPVIKEVAASDNQSEEFAFQDPAVKVVVRVRPSSSEEFGGKQILKGTGEDSLSVGDRKFTFDSVLDSRSNQEDVFEVVGVPLVKNALAGYNTTILSYGQSGSGKTYTLWGPPSSMVDEPSSNSERGLVPRIFEMLFSMIEREQQNSEGKQMNFQCRCSFLEIYNEKIGDLLDPMQRDLQIKDDQKNGLYVDNLSEEYVTSYEDVTQILIKGLSSRKVGATTVNSKSSRSHIVFTCIIESWCKESSSKCFNSSKISRISLVDLAGLDPSKVDDGSRQAAREAKHVKKSLSHLGRLVSALAKRSQLADEDAPYKSSCLTHLLRESFGGNAKLTVICTIPSNNKNDGELLSTLRFGQRVKHLKNNPVVNEITEDDVNDLSDQIRQLKDELIRAKSHGHKGLDKHYARVSLNQLRVSLNRSLLLPHSENLEEEANIDENDVKELRQQLDKLDSSEESNSREESFETEYSEDFTNCPEEFESETESTMFADALSDAGTARSVDGSLRTSISLNAIRCSQILEGPMLSESPKIGKANRKSLIMSSSVVASSDRLMKDSEDAPEQNFRQSQSIRSSLRTSKLFPGQTESLAASLQRGLEIIDYQQRNSGSQRSSLDFSFEHLTLKPSPDVVNARESCSVDQSPASFLCRSCQRRCHEVHNSQGLDNDLAEALARVRELENICKEQEAKINELTCSTEQNQMEKGQGSSILCIEASTEAEEPKTEVVKSENHENLQLLICNEEKCVVKEVQEEVKQENESSNTNEKEELLKEIHALRSKLQSYPDTYPNKSIERLRSSVIRRSMQLQKSFSISEDNSEEELEKERQRWMEMESEWISLTDELRIDIETNRERAEKLEMELRSEKNCTEELDDALHRSVLGHARMVEHYAELQDRYNDLAGRHRTMMEVVADVKKAAAKAGSKGHGYRFAKSLNAELSAMRVEKEREREFLKKENLKLKNQLRDTAEAVHAAGELLVRLREAEQATSASEETLAKIREENENLRKQIEKMKRKHKMEVVTMKQYMAESKLPESALPPSYKEVDSYDGSDQRYVEDDQSWRAEFGAIYQDHY